MVVPFLMLSFNRRKLQSASREQAVYINQQ